MANDFLPFSTSGTANVYTNAEYVADTDQTNGNQPGIAKSKLINKALRQCSIISTVVAQFISDITGTNAVDDGTTATLLADLKTATSISYNTHAATSKTTPVDADEIPFIDSAASFGLKKITWANIKAALTSLFAPLDSPTFTGTPTAPTAAAGTNTTQLATTAFAMRAGIGSNQAWQDVTASRVSGTTYTNSTGKPIIIKVTSGTTNIAMTVGGVLISASNNAANSEVIGIVPNSYTYVVTATITKWFELR